MLNESTRIPAVGPSRAADRCCLQLLGRYSPYRASGGAGVGVRVALLGLGVQTGTQACCCKLPWSEACCYSRAVSGVAAALASD